MSHAYKIVLFPDDVGQKLSVDVVPSKWIYESEEHESKMCPFPVGPFTGKSIARLHKMVEKCDPADESWPVHRVLIHGRAHTYAEAIKSADRLQYDNFAFSTDRESSVEKIFTEENRTSASKQPRKPVQDELNGATFEMAPAHIDQKKENRLNSRARTSSVISGSSPEKKGRSSADDSSNESPGQSKTDENRRRLNFNREFKSFQEKPSAKERSARSQTVENSRKRSHSSSSDCSPTPSERPESSMASATSRNTKRRRLLPSMDRGYDSRRSNSVSPQPLEHTVTETHRRSRSTDRVPTKNKNDSHSSSGSRSRRSFSADMARKDTEEMLNTSLGNQRSPLITEQSREGEEEREENYTLTTVVEMLKKVHASLSSKIDRTYGKTVELSGRINEIKMQSHQPRPEAEEFDVAEPIELPIDSKENFTLFDTKILEDQEYRKRINNRVRHMIPRDRNYDTHHLSTILRVYLKKEFVLSTFTSVRAKNEKIPLKDTNFFKCLLAVHQRVLGENMNEQKFKVHLKASLNSAKDWDGGRAFRRG